MAFVSAVMNTWLLLEQIPVNLVKKKRDQLPALLHGRSSRVTSVDLCGRTIKFANSPLCACRGSTGQKP